MTIASPPTAASLIALVESHLKSLSKKEKSKFWSLITDRNDNTFFVAQMKLYFEIVELFGSSVTVTIKETGEALSKLKTQINKHRKPTRNAERDADIMRLHAEKKTAGEIVMAMKGRYRLTDKMVNAVISRQREKLKAV